jgi:hypothetical protein
MNSPESRSAGKLFTAVVACSVFLATLLIAASWSVRSEARDRAEKSSGKSAKSSSSYGFTTSDDGVNEFSYAVIEPDRNTTHFSGSDLDDIERLKDQYDQDLFWFSLRGDSYVVTDEDVVERAKEIVAPMSELGSKQGRLGGKQAAIGGKQAAIGAKQARIGGRQAALSTLLAAMALEGGPESERNAIEDELEDLGRKMEELSRQHEPLAREQEALGRQQAELGRQMERLSARVQAEIRELADDARAEGKAERVR